MQVESLAHLAEGCIFMDLMLSCRAMILVSHYKSLPSLNLILPVYKEVKLGLCFFIHLAYLFSLSD